MKKTMKKRAFVSAIAMLIVSAIVLTSSTFAWFSMAKKVEVESMQLNVTSPDGVQISCNPDAFTTSLTREDILGTSNRRFQAYTGAQNHIPDILSPSSSRLFCQNYSFPQFFAGSVDDNGKLNVSAVTDAGGGYVVFDVFIKVAAAMTLYIKSSDVTSTDVPDIRKAARIAVVPCGVGTLTGSELGSSPLTQWKPKAQNGSVMYALDSVNHIEGVDGTKDNNQYFFSAASGITPIAGTTITNDTTRTSAASASCQYYPSTGNPQVSVAVGVNRFRVYMWIEGNDIDCTNDVAGATVDFKLAFSMDA